MDLDLQSSPAFAGEGDQRSWWRGLAEVGRALPPRFARSPSPGKPGEDLEGGPDQRRADLQRGGEAGADPLRGGGGEGDEELAAVSGVGPGTRSGRRGRNGGLVRSTASGSTSCGSAAMAASPRPWAAGRARRSRGPGAIACSRRGARPGTRSAARSPRSPDGAEPFASLPLGVRRSGGRNPGDSRDDR